MKTFKSPEVELIGCTHLESTGVYQFLKEHELGWVPDSNADSELISEFGGRICYMSFGKGRKSTEEYMGHILESAHGSVLEHCVWNFALWGISRSLTHELVRHRAGVAFSQLSQRYVDESVAEYVIPPLFQDSGEKVGYEAEYIKDLEFIHSLYLKWADKAGEIIDKFHPHLQGTDKRKNARQAARSVLPNATETKMLFTCNTRALRHVIENRASIHADVEIRNLAVKLYEIASKRAPNMFQDSSIVDLPDGTRAVSFKHKKV